MEDIRSIDLMSEDLKLTDLSNVCFAVEYYHKCGEIDSAAPLLDKLEAFQGQGSSTGSYHARKTLLKIRFLDAYYWYLYLIYLCSKFRV